MDCIYIYLLWDNRQSRYGYAWYQIPSVVSRGSGCFRCLWWWFIYTEIITVSGADTCAGLHHRRSRLLALRPSSASSKKPQLMMPSLARGDLFAVFCRRSKPPGLPSCRRPLRYGRWSEGRKRTEIDGDGRYLSKRSSSSSRTASTWWQWRSQYGVHVLWKQPPSERPKKKIPGPLRGSSFLQTFEPARMKPN